MSDFEKAYFIGRILYKWDSSVNMTMADILRMCRKKGELEYWFRLIMYAEQVNKKYASDDNQKTD